MRKNKKAFTLIEVLSVIIIIGVIALIAIPTVSNYLGSSKESTYISYEKSMEDATKNSVVECLKDNKSCVVDVDVDTKVYLENLIEAGFIENMKDPDGGGFCDADSSYVVIDGNTPSDYEYQACLYCGDYITDSSKCQPIATDGDKPVCGPKTGESTTWTNVNRTITVGCSDAGSGCEQNVFSKTFTTTSNTIEGKLGVATITIRDKSGMTENCEVDAYVDKTEPSCTIELDGEYLSDKGWYAEGVKGKITNVSDSESGVLTYGMGTSAKEVEYNKKNELTVGSGITTIMGYVKDNAGNEKICGREVKVGSGRPTFNLYYGYQIFPFDEFYTTSGITENGTSFTTTNTTPTITINGLSRYKDVEKVKVKLTNTILEQTMATIKSGTMQKNGIMLVGNNEILFEIPKGSYNSFEIKLGTLSGKQYDIEKIEVITKDGTEFTAKDEMIYIEPLDKGIRTTKTSFDGGTTYLDNTFSQIFTSQTDNSVVTKNALDLVSDPVAYNIKIDKIKPTMTIVGQRKSTGEQIVSGSYVNEGLNFILTKQTEGPSGSKLYYCVDTTNTCIPNIEAQSGELVTSQNNITTDYYLRYRAVGGGGEPSNITTYEARYDHTQPTCTFGSITNVFVNMTNTLELTCTDSSMVRNLDLTSDSFTLSNTGLVVESVTKAQINGGMKYTITLRGVTDGTTQLVLKPNVVFDGAGNGNLAINKNITVNGVFRVDLDPQGGTNPGATAVYEYYGHGWYTTIDVTTPISSVSKPNKTGYTFEGYYSQPNGEGNQITDANGAFVSNSSYAVVGDGPMYAKWTANELNFTIGTHTKTWGSSTSITVGATNGTGNYEYTTTTPTNGISISGNRITFSSGLEVGSYSYTVHARDTVSGKEKDATFTVVVNKVVVGRYGGNSIMYCGVARGDGVSCPPHSTKRNSGGIPAGVGCFNGRNYTTYIYCDINDTAHYVFDNGAYSYSTYWYAVEGRGCASSCDRVGTTGDCSACNAGL